MNRWKAILAAALIFSTGAATGIFAHRTASRVTATPPRDLRTPPPLFDGRQDFLGRLQRDLNLTDDQAKRIDVVLQDGRKRNRQIWETVQPQLREEMKKARERIHAELDPEQRVKYDEIMKRSRERRGPRPEGPGTGPDGGRRRGGKGPPPGPGDTNGASARPPGGGSREMPPAPNPARSSGTGTPTPP